MYFDTKLRALKPKEKSCRIADEKGLYVQVSLAGTCLFRFKYRFDGKEKLLSFGQYPDISLSQARELSDNTRKIIAQGLGPPPHRKKSLRTLSRTPLRQFLMSGGLFVSKACPKARL
jgi:hypothetical protein